MTDLFDPLQLKNCPLLNEQVGSDMVLLRRYEIACKQFQLLFGHFGEEMRDDPTVKPLVNEMERVRNSLAKSHYAIGFIGPTQSGKSTAFNYVLDAVDTDDQPCKEGGGDNTTATVSRIRRGKRSLSLIYMTPSQLDKKRELLCRVTAFDPDVDDRDILSRVPARMAEVQNGRTEHLLANEPILPRDVELLKELLETVVVSGRLIADPAVVDDSRGYEHRERFLNYGSDSDPAKTLLREARLCFESEHLPDELEMFDLPGPGAKSSVDKWTTRQYLPEMDGVMLFVNATKLGDQAVEELYGDLRSIFKERIGRRVWIVFTRWDGPTRPALVGDGKQCVFSSIDAFLKEKKVDPKQVRFVCAPWYLTSDPKTRVTDHFRERLKGDSAIPLTLKLYSQFEPAFQELFDGGGIPSLRKLILQELPQDVRAEIATSSSQSLDRICTGLHRRFQNEVRRRTANEQQQSVASRCKKLMDELLARIEDELAPYESAATALRESLRETFIEVCAKPEILTRNASVPDDFPTHVDELEKRLHAVIDANTFPKLYQHWQPMFDAIPVIDVMDCPGGCGEVWQSFSQPNEEEREQFMSQFPTFYDSHLFANGDADTRRDLIDGEAYHSMMKEKINLVSQQAVHAIRVRLIHRGREIKENIDQLVRTPADLPARSLDTYSGAMDEMDRLLLKPVL